MDPIKYIRSNWTALSPIYNFAIAWKERQPKCVESGNVFFHSFCTGGKGTVMWQILKQAIQFYYLKSLALFSLNLTPWLFLLYLLYESE